MSATRNRVVSVEGFLISSGKSTCEKHIVELLRAYSRDPLGVASTGYGTGKLWQCLIKHIRRLQSLVTGNHPWESNALTVVDDNWKVVMCDDVIICATRGHDDHHTTCTPESSINQSFYFDDIVKRKPDMSDVAEGDEYFGLATRAAEILSTQCFLAGGTVRAIGERYCSATRDVQPSDIISTFSRDPLCSGIQFSTAAASLTGITMDQLMKFCSQMQALLGQYCGKINTMCDKVQPGEMVLVINWEDILIEWCFGGDRDALMGWCFKNMQRRGRKGEIEGHTEKTFRKFYSMDHKEEVFDYVKKTCEESMAKRYSFVVNKENILVVLRACVNNPVVKTTRLKDTAVLSKIFTSANFCQTVMTEDEESDKHNLQESILRGHALQHAVAFITLSVIRAMDIRDLVTSGNLPVNFCRARNDNERVDRDGINYLCSNIYEAANAILSAATISHDG